ncbi:SagB/ThcOx family dehydrogenase [Thermodesulforhabdus norvegica]|uniref:SagB-type dehydrogenase domain-containing protein n=1 Tax=Thermodesulforhabdus norvegica TaxID=39841 RepID=A0A1I4W2P5_9BACT|nr:SagB/ThcOx family dehydrogenase [Thermodesulforhabdus norvegica]SFN07733.1 SagB-type dehydrogenase domain-containing protein [Thermodesulforhabdus norvegica]
MTGYEYHRYTAYSRWRLGGRGGIRGGRPELFKKYRGSEIKKFPESLLKPDKKLMEVVLWRLPGSSSALFDENLLGLLFFLSYGIRPDSGLRGYPFRTVPSAGALYPCELYFCPDGIGPWEGGFYHYRADLHGAERIAKGGGSGSGLDVKVSVLPYRSAFKYGERALRYVLLDAGHLIEQIRMAGRIVGLEGLAYSGCEEPSVWEKAAGLSADHEVFIGGVRFGEPDCANLMPVMPIPEMQRCGELASGGDCGPVIREVLDAIRHGCFVFDEEPEIAGYEDESLPDISAFNAIIGRRSHRNYTGKTISYGVFDLFVRALGSLSDYSGFVVYFALAAVEGFTPGVYLLKADEAVKKGCEALGRIRSASVMTELAHACLGQGWMANGSFAVIIALSFEDAERAYGDRGYMHLMINAGRVGQRIYLLSEGFGLGCCGVGAFYDGDVSDVVPMDDDTYPVYVIPVGSRSR